MTKTNGGLITRVDELKHVMRSLGMSPTEPELDNYFKQKGLQFLGFIHKVLMIFFLENDFRRKNYICRSIRHNAYTFGTGKNPYRNS